MLTFLIINLKSYRKYLILRINIYPLSRRLLSQRAFHCDESEATPMPPSLAWPLLEGHTRAWLCVPGLAGTTHPDPTVHTGVSHKAEAGLPLTFARRSTWCPEVAKESPTGTA